LKADWLIGIISLSIATAILAYDARQKIWTYTSGASPTKTVQAGDIVTALPRETWTGGSPTLVFAMQVGCHWCEASADFYRRLLQDNDGHSFHPVVAMPQSPTEGAAYLRKLGLNVTDVRQADFHKLGVPGTPTLILVDGRGRVTASWVGYQPPDKQQALLNRLLPTRTAHNAQSNLKD